jgi:predicted dehydrogenase
MGMAGGGEGAFIGEIHRAAARLDGRIELVCGAFSSKPEVSRQTGEKLGLLPDRVYSNWQQMLAQEADLPAGSRMEFLSIVTPNDLHFPIAKHALESGFHVLCDKPATRSLAEAQLLAETVDRTKRCYALTNTYLGYPMVVEARERILEGAVGKVRHVTIAYAQGWLSTRLEAAGHRQAQWRTSSQRAGVGGAVGDIGTHAFSLAEYITGLQVTQLCADLAVSVTGRELDDKGAAFLRFANGAHGTLTISQVSAGEENELTIRVYGEAGGIVWSHSDHNSLRLLSLDGSARTLRAGSNISDLHPEALSLCRTPAGHPEGFIEAFANLYRLFVADIHAPSAALGLVSASPAPVSVAVRGMAFVDAMVRSNAAGQKWMALAA